MAESAAAGQRRKTAAIRSGVARPVVSPEGRAVSILVFEGWRTAAPERRKRIERRVRPSRFDATAKDRMAEPPGPWRSTVQAGMAVAARPGPETAQTGMAAAVRGG